MGGLEENRSHAVDVGVEPTGPLEDFRGHRIHLGRDARVRRIADPGGLVRHEPGELLLAPAVTGHLPTSLREELGRRVANAPGDPGDEYGGLVRHKAEEEPGPCKAQAGRRELPRPWIPRSNLAGSDHRFVRIAGAWTKFCSDSGCLIGNQCPLVKSSIHTHAFEKDLEPTEQSQSIGIKKTGTRSPGQGTMRRSRGPKTEPPWVTCTGPDHTFAGQPPDPFPLPFNPDEQRPLFEEGRTMILRAPLSGPGSE